MNIKTVSLQFSVFGDFQEISATPEIINMLTELFRGFREPLLPVSIQQTTELNNKSDGPSSKKDGFMSLIFFNSQKNFSIQFNSSRIDLEKIIQIENSSSEDNEIDLFKEDTMFVLKKVLTQYKKKCNRLAIVRKSITKEMSDEKINSIFNRIFQLPNELTSHEKRHWNFSVTNRFEFKFSTCNEKINSIITFARSMKEPIDLDLDKNRFALILDVNTIPENKEHRFDIEDINFFFDDVFKFQNNQISTFSEHIKL